MLDLPPTPAGWFLVRPVPGGLGVSAGPFSAPGTGSAFVVFGGCDLTWRAVGDVPEQSPGRGVARTSPAFAARRNGGPGGGDLRNDPDALSAVGPAVPPLSQAT